jgi:hypothetical protein
MRTPLGYKNVADDHGKKHVAKNPEHQHVIDALERAFDECGSLGEVARRLNREGPQRPAFHGRGGESKRWMVYGLRYILANDIYTGKFRFGIHTKERSTVWDKFAVDEDGQIKDFERHHPELGYWPAAKVRAWRRKFSKPSNTRVMNSGHQHPLAGVLECESCGSRMIGYGEGTYCCSARGVGRGTDGRHCDRPQKIREFVVLGLLRQEVANVLADAQGLAERARAHLIERQASPLVQRLAFLEDRAEDVTNKIFDEDTPKSMVDRLHKKLAETERELETLREQITEEEDARLSDEQLAATCDILLTNPLAILDSVPAERQGRIYSLLFANVRIETRGFGGGRNWRLQSYTARLIDEWRVTEHAPWARCPHPRTRYEGERPTLIFDAAAMNVGKDTIGRSYAPYLPSLRELAAALASV